MNYEQRRQAMWKKSEARAQYKAYLKTHHWQKTRKTALKAGYGRCKQCGSTYRLEVDHKTYRDEKGSILGRENPQKDLQLLCSRCHDKKR